MIIRPNAILLHYINDSGEWNIIYIKTSANEYLTLHDKYVKTLDMTNLDPFVNWSSILSCESWVFPVYAKVNELKGGWNLRAFDTYNQLRSEGKETTFKEISERGILKECFEKILNRYNNYTDDELLIELSYNFPAETDKEYIKKVFSDV